MRSSIAPPIRGRAGRHRRRRTRRRRRRRPPDGRRSSRDRAALAVAPAQTRCRARRARSRPCGANAFPVPMAPCSLDGRAPTAPASRWRGRTLACRGRRWVSAAD
jgi:hypothetical protein